jgi:hypothetical protein
MTTNFMPTSVVDTFDTAILTRAMSPARGTLSRQAAQEILQWGFPPEDKQRMAELSAKVRRGELTSEEELEIDSYVRVGHIINLMQAKARLTITQATDN